MLRSVGLFRAVSNILVSIILQKCSPTLTRSKHLDIAEVVLVTMVVEVNSEVTVGSKDGAR